MTVKPGQKPAGLDPRWSDEMTLTPKGKREEDVAAYEAMRKLRALKPPKRRVKP